MPGAQGREPALRIEGLTLTLPDETTLLENASLCVDPGEFVLVVGRSGSGKSTLLRLIAGLDEPDAEGPRTTGQILVNGHSAAMLRAGSVGLVFQSHALFDELSAEDNVQFALDHRSSANGGGTREAKGLLDRLGVPSRGRLSVLSGGERQRVAVARTLAMDSPILLFDEPIAGLDPARARSVADLIHETYRQFEKTVVVVTHDFEPFLRFQPRLVLADPDRRALIDIDAQGLAEYFSKPVAPTAFESPAKSPEATWTGWIAPWVEWPGRALWTLGLSILAPWGGWRRPRWKLAYLWHYLRMTALGTTAIYVSIAGAMLGFVFITFSFSNLPYSNITLPLLTEEFLAATGYSMFRVVVPLLIAVLMAGKCGASAAADLGARRLTSQYEAMVNLGASPREYLFGNLVLAMAVAGPLLTLIGFATACYSSLVAYLMTSPQTTVAGFQRNFFATMWPAGWWFPKGCGWVLIKSITGGILIASLAYTIGSRPKQSSVQVSRDVSYTIFWASLGVLMLNALYSFVEF
jgi:ABC-type lipoprotein export system ATPase subunit/ABC-type transporter Mla maintaining outer membrane lipid asymmetry permease subunit MlaE